MRIKFLASAAFAQLLMILFANTASAQWSVELTKDAAAIIRYDDATVANFKYVAWGKGWEYADFKTAIGRNGGETWAISGGIDKLKTTVEGKIDHVGETFVFTWNLETSDASAGNIGGVDFHFRLNPRMFGPNAGKPQLLNDGWSWTPTQGQTVTARATGTGIKSYFEKNKPDQVRLLFVPSTLQPGTTTATLTLTLPPGTKRTDGVSIRYAKLDTTKWFTKSIDWTKSPVDLSYLNDKPAGVRGFVKADGDKLVFADGSETRFWGCNIVAYALFNASNEAIEQQAKRIAALGFNLVRIHHHDSANWSPSVFASGANDTGTLDAKNLDRIDYWVKCLKDQGVYVWLDLHVGRPFKPGDKIDGYDELDPGNAGRQAKGLSYVNASVTARMKEFAKAYLTHVNPYTKTAYTDEPAVMGVLITNENDISNHFGNLFLKEKKHPYHQQQFETLRDKIVKQYKLDAGQAWRTWEAGPSKVVLDQIEYDWGKDFVDYLHSVGVKVPIATTNTWGSNPLFSLPPLVAGDVIDVHSYGTPETLSSNPAYSDMSTHWIAAAQVQNKPLIITEWNTPWPSRDRFTQGMFIAANAAFQGWDAPMIYAYQQDPLVPQNRMREWTTANDPAQMAMMPAAALLYRQGHVAPAKQTVVFAPGEDLLMKNISPENSVALRTLAERHKLVIGLPVTPLLPWLKAVPSDREQVITADPDKPADGVTTGPQGQEITSDTGELSRNYRQGIYTINTPKSQAALGWIGGQTIKLTDVTFDITTAKASVAVTALDDQPIDQSKRLLISTVAQAEYSKKGVGGSNIFAEPVTGRITFKSPPKSVRLLKPDGQPGSEIKLRDGKVELPFTSGTHWYLVTR